MAEQRVNLADRDPELVAGLSGDRLTRARRELVAPLHRIEVGSWDPAALAGSDHWGVVVLEGIVRRAVFLDRSSKSVDLLGSGDILRPASEDPYGSLPTQVEWSVIEPGEVAVLDPGFARAAGELPEVMGVLLNRAVTRSLRISVKEAITAAPEVEPRLIATLWSLADRWGVVTPNGVALRLPLTHRLLAEMIGAQRPSVTTALGRLRERGVVEQGEDGWLLHGDPPIEPEDFRSPAE